MTAPTATAPGELTLELFEAGTWNGNTFGIEDIDAACRNAVLLQDYIKPRLVLGHSRPGDQPEMGRMEQPAVGHLKPGSLRRIGKKMVGTFTEIPPVVMQSLRAKLYTSQSIEAYEDFTRTRVARELEANVPGFRAPTGLTLASCAVLGSAAPACKTVSDLGAYLRAEDGGEESVWLDGPRVHWAEDKPADDVADDADEGDTHDDEPSVAQRLARAEAALEELARQRGDLARRKQALRDNGDDTVMHGKGFGPVSYGERFNERLDNADRMLTALAERGRAAAQKVDNMNVDAVKKFGAFAPEAADKASDLGSLFLDELENLLWQSGVNRTDPQSRARFARELLAAWKSRPPSPHGPEAASLADQLEPEAYSAAVNDYARGGQDDARDPSTITQVKLSERDGDGPPLYGSAALLARELGGANRVQRFHELAREHHLSLARPADRAKAEQLLFAEMGNGLADSLTFEEAVSAYRREHALTFSEADQRTAALAVAKQRPDLAGQQYGTRGRPVPEQNARAICMEDAAREELKQIPIDTPGRTGLAWRRAAARHPALTPDYAWNTRARRATR